MATTDTATSHNGTPENASSSNNFHHRYPFNQHRDSTGHLNQIVLQSSDGVKFGIESVVLRIGSEFFSRMLEIPREQTESNEEPIPMAETSRVVTAILDIIHPHSTFNGSTSFSNFEVDFVDQMLAAAEKYEIPKVVSFLRINVMQFLSVKPLEIYSISSKYGWTEESRASILEAIKLGFSELVYSPIFESLSAKALRDLYSLQASLHRHFWEIIERIKTRSCFSFMSRNRDYSKTFDNLSRHLYVEFEKRPFDKTQLARDVFTEQPNFIAFCDVVVGQRVSITALQVTKGDIVLAFEKGIEEMFKMLERSSQGTIR